MMCSGGSCCHNVAGSSKRTGRAGLVGFWIAVHKLVVHGRSTSYSSHDWHLFKVFKTLRRVSNVRRVRRQFNLLADKQGSATWGVEADLAADSGRPQDR
eukprot:646696-Amphidinium_carterae.1